MQYISVPKNISRVQEEIFGYPIRYIGVLFAAFVASFVLIYGVVASYKSGGYISIALYFYLILLFLELYVFFTYARSPAILRRSWLMYVFFIAGLRNQNLTAKLVHSEDIVKSVMPIDRIHDGGIIEFRNKQFGRLLVIDPPRIDDDNLESHNARVVNLVNSLNEGVVIKSYAVSVPSNVRPAERSILKIMNDGKSDRTQEVQEHLYSLYSHTHNNNNMIVQWRFYLFVSYGTHDSISKARVAELQYLPGILSRLHKSDIYEKSLTSYDEIVASYRSIFQLQEVM